MIAATIRALQRGYTQAQADPESAVTALVEADSGLYRAAAQAQLDAVAAAFTAGARAPTASYARTSCASGRAGTSSSGSSSTRSTSRAFDFSLVGPVSNP